MNTWNIIRTVSSALTLRDTRTVSKILMLPVTTFLSFQAEFTYSEWPGDGRDLRTQGRVQPKASAWIRAEQTVQASKL